MAASTWSPSPLIFLSCIFQTEHISPIVLPTMHHLISTLYQQSISYVLSLSFFSLDSPSHCISSSLIYFFSVTPKCPTILSLLFLIAIEFPSRCFPRSMPFKTSISVPVEALPFATTTCNIPSKGPSSLYHPHVLMIAMTLVRSFLLRFVSFCFLRPSRFVIYSRLNPVMQYLHIFGDLSFLRSSSPWLAHGQKEYIFRCCPACVSVEHVLLCRETILQTSVC